MMQLATSGRLPSLPGETRPLEDVGNVLSRLRDGKIVGRTVVMP
jgi:D-arabinose 1-dehydrogenase-like Zn-dependent alcohol dehydrogenase